MVAFVAILVGIQLGGRLSHVGELKHLLVDISALSN